MDAVKVDVSLTARTLVAGERVSVLLEPVLLPVGASALSADSALPMPSLKRRLQPLDPKSVAPDSNTAIKALRWVGIKAINRDLITLLFSFKTCHLGMCPKRHT